MNFSDQIRMLKVALAAGLYYVAIGLWPLLSMQSFSAATKLSHHLDLVQAVAIAWASLGLALLVFSRSLKIVPYLAVVSTFAGSMLALAEIILVTAGLLSPLFLVQAMSEMLIGFTWMRTLLPRETMTRIQPRPAKTPVLR